MRTRHALLATLLLSAACGGSDDDGPRIDASGGGAIDAGGGGTIDAGGSTIDAGVADLDLSGPGPRQVEEDEGVAELPTGDVDVSLCTPVGVTGRPLAIVSPGFQMGRDQYLSYCRHLASWGYPTIVASHAGLFPDHSDNANNLRALLDWADDATALAAWDGERVGLSGHSLGGKLSILAAVRDARIGVVIGWDPVDAGNPSVTPELMGSMVAPLVLVGETTDATSTGFGQACAPAADNFTRYYDAADGTAIELTVAGADHMDWVDDPSCFACGFCNEGTADADFVRALTRRTTTAALRRFLENDAAAATYLDGDAIQTEAAAGLLSVRSK